MKKVFNKLVRNRIPDIISTQNEIPHFRILDDKEYEEMLEKKLDEEVKEYHEDKNLEELSDILEVLLALCEIKGYSKEELIDMYTRKHEEKGGFSKKIYLISKE